MIGERDSGAGRKARSFGVKILYMIEIQIVHRKGLTNIVIYTIVLFV